MRKITLVAAYARNRVIGADGKMPWHLPEDFAFFKAYTLGKPVVMGRKTWESLPVRPLPGRRNIVVTRQTDFEGEGAETAFGLMDAVSLCDGEAEIVIMGGGQIYEQAMGIATDLRITEIDLAAEGDVFFPKIEDFRWQEVERIPHVAANGIGYAFVHYVRVPKK
ncbi:MAG: dihydrofolate reductase [Neisseria sp.]|nr:dihydrofolate reductase [Neisseria sp.]